MQNVFLFFTFLSITTPQVEKNGDWSTSAGFLFIITCYYYKKKKENLLLLKKKENLHSKSQNAFS